MSVITVTEQNYNELIESSKNTVLLDFWATWCGPCRMLSPIIEELAEEHPEITVGKINVDNEPNLASRFNVMSIPSLFVLREGEIVNQAVGAMPKEQLEQLL